MDPRLYPAGALPARRLLALALLALGACTQAPLRSAPAPAPATRLPPPVPMSVCIGCGRISAMEPADLPRWRFTVQMDDGTEVLVFQEQTAHWAPGAKVRLVKGILEPR